MCKLTMLTFALAGCLGQAPPPDPSQNPAPVSDQTSRQNATPSNDPLGVAPTTASADPSNTFNHESNQVDPFAVLARIQEEGPPEVSSRMHSCQKMKYVTLGHVLTQLGVNLDANGQNGIPTAGDLYQGGSQAMGAPNYGARVPETIGLTTAGATKLFDIFVSAAPEIIASIAAGNACKAGGNPTQLFDTNGKCTIQGISCLVGAPATQMQADLCNQALGEASTPDLGQTIAVAAILSAAHTCE
jgi:hypothetical protein